MTRAKKQTQETIVEPKVKTEEIQQEVMDPTTKDEPVKEDMIVPEAAVEDTPVVEKTEEVKIPASDIVKYKRGEDISDEHRALGIKHHGTWKIRKLGTRTIVECLAV